ncbi:MAG: hypothetical protein HYU66_25600 [Armatimonadetes bacterium]|nr:hypothetical protein [Armatimonadota bacterium]
MHWNRFVALAGGVGLIIALMIGCGSTTANPNNQPGSRSAYAGSPACRTCHPSQYREEREHSGHPYKLVRVTNGVAPQFAADAVNGPYQPVTTPPAGITWSDVAYVIGGYGWKGRFVDLAGYVVTGTNVQWQMRTRRWVNYKATVPRGGLPYDYACFKCHTTGAKDGTADLSTHQDGRLGMQGTFEETGVTCEACHGPGAAHVQAPSKANIVLNAGTQVPGNGPTPRSADDGSNDDDEGEGFLFSLPRAAGSRQVDRQRALTCGDCHERKGLGNISAEAGWVEHHEQREMLHASGAHRLLDCTTCHDPHRGTIYNNIGIRKECTSCHGFKQVNHAPGVECVDCHMPFAAKSGDAASPYQADVRSHITRIRTTNETKAAFYSADGTQVQLDVNGNAALTLDYACYGCHQDATGAGGSGSVKTLDELAAKAVTIHN